MKVQNDIDLFINVYSIIEAVSTCFKVDIDTSKYLVLKALKDKRLNILEIISEIYQLEIEK